jgi:hypothetical protein
VGWWAAGCWQQCNNQQSLPSAICNLPSLGWLLWLQSCLWWLALALNLARQPVNTDYIFFS